MEEQIALASLKRPHAISDRVVLNPFSLLSPELALIIPLSSILSALATKSTCLVPGTGHGYCQDGGTACTGGTYYDNFCAASPPTFRCCVGPSPLLLLSCLLVLVYR